MSKVPIAGGPKFIPTSEPGERIPLGHEVPHDKPDTKPSSNTQWKGK